ncbi:hypothetical protein QL285_056400 [Trifolium repens]|jgi:hypothetical protein|nr:hypothetical protein QL285_056400 [Trifolium repens]
MTKSVTDRLHTVNRKWKTNVKSEIPRLQGLKSTTAMDGNCKSPSSSFFSTEKDQGIIIIIDHLTWHKNPIIENDQTSPI